MAEAPLFQKALGGANGKILVIGDAAGFFDPITDEGIGIAARQALLLEKICRAGIERKFWKSCKGNV